MSISHSPCTIKNKIDKYTSKYTKWQNVISTEKELEGAHVFEILLYQYISCLLILVTTLGGGFTLPSTDKEPFWADYNNGQKLGDMLCV